MRPIRWSFVVLWPLLVFPCQRTWAQSDRIYGKVYTQDDQVYEGTIRWDDHETFWGDILDASQEIPGRGEGERRERRKEIEVLGLKISWTETEEDEGERQFDICMGRLQSIQRRSKKAAILTLKDNSRVRVTGSGTDIGSANRGIIVDDRVVGQVTVDWSEFEKVVFSPQPQEAGAGSEIWRLYGTATTWDGQRFRGFIRWDDDECLSCDVLDGESREEDLEIPFANILAIERKSSSSAQVELTSGQKIRLRGTNDVDQGNRGLIVHVPHFGHVTIDWDDFERIELEEPGPHLLKGYEHYDAGEPLWGTVWDDDGKAHRGMVRWDDDESMTYEFLDGEMGDLEVRIEFADIQSIRRQSSRSAAVKLNSGETVILQGTCDVDEENRGILVSEEDGRTVRLDWDQFDRVEFGRP